MDPARGTLIAYAAGAGQTAADSAPGAANGLFTAKLVEALGAPGVTARELFLRVREQVFEASNSAQFPALYDQLLSDVVLRRPAVSGSGADVGGRAAGGAAPVPDAAIAARLDLAFWEGIVGSDEVLDFEDYLERFPNGTFVGLARRRLESLRAEELRIAVLPRDDILAPVEENERVDFFDLDAFAFLRPEIAMIPGGVARLPSELPDLVEVVDGVNIVGWGTADAPRRAIWERFRDCAVCPEMVVVPSGRFMMGSSGWVEAFGEWPRHEVRIEVPFAVGLREVTFDEWDACVRGGGCDGYWPSDRGWGRGTRPVINVSWHDAQTYVRWLSTETGEHYRLPSESEWEYAARGDTITAYWWGNGPGEGRGVCDGCGSTWDAQQTAPTGSFQANGFGLFDVAGNVREWVADCWHGDYEGAPADGREWVTGRGCGEEEAYGVLRGGAWADLPDNLRSARRIRNSRWNRGGIAGFRVAMTLGGR